MMNLSPRSLSHLSYRSAFLLAISLSTLLTSSAENWVSGQDVSLGGILFPHLHATGTYGGISGVAENLGVAHHDPTNDALTLNLEAGLSMQAGEHVEGFATYAFQWDDAERSWDDELEEAFLKIKDLPGGIDLRGGQYFNRYGLQNTFHYHGWDFVDQNLVSGRFLGEEGLVTQGGEITWKLPFDSQTLTSLLSISVGQAVTHDEEGHGHEEEHGGEHEEEYGDEHGDEHEEEAHGFESEEALFTKVVAVVNWTNLWQIDDFHSARAGLSFATGKNGWGRQSRVWGTHLEYQWRENGMEAGGKYFRWRTEMMLRDLQAASEDERRNLREFGASTALTFGQSFARLGRLEAGLRFDYVEGIAAAELDERWRLSPALTWHPTNSRYLAIRVQYNLDHSNSGDTNHGVWAQVGLNWGGTEVR